MAVFLSPGVFPREVDLSVLPKSAGALRPAFVGAAQKGPLNEPTLITSAAQFIETFGNPFPESALGYAVIAYFEEGASAWVMRVGVEFNEGLSSELQDIAIDTSGGNVEGWGRIPVFQGIDYGIIRFREVTSDAPVVIHAAGVEDINYSDAELELGTDGPTDATLVFSIEAYTGSVDEIFTLSITGDPTGSGPIDGATYSIQDSGGTEVDSGTLTTATDPSVSEDIVLVDEGLTFAVSVTSGVLATGDVFTWRAIPDNTTMSVVVEGGTEETIVLSTGTYSDADALVAEIESASPTDFDAVAVEDADGNEVPSIRTKTSGEWIQLTGTAGFAAEVGVQQYDWDIPRSYVIGTTEGPYVITSSNNQIAVDVISSIDGDTTSFNFAIATGTAVTASALASQFDANGTVSGTKHFESFTLTVPGGTVHQVIATTTNNKQDQVKLLANFSNQETLNYVETVGISFPFTRAFRGFSDPQGRLVSPDASSSDASVPASCSAGDGGDPLSTQCLLDSAYYSNIVGFIVAQSAGTWVDDFTVSLRLYTEGIGDVAGRYVVDITEVSSGLVVESITDVTFDPDDDRYIANLVNPGQPLAPTNGDPFIRWEDRDASIGAGEVRNPAAFNAYTFAGGANGIPVDPADSPELDNAVIGSPADQSGLFALSNPESFDFNLLAIPGFSSGPVIAQGLQFAENRGDVLYLVDPPFGLRAQQMVDWHNGMLTSDLTSALNSSFGALYWSFIKISDQFNGGTIFVPPSGHVAAVFARTARVAEQWFAPAGINRGRILTALDIESNPTQGERDLLQGNGNAVNPLVKFIQDGTVVFGQRTLQRQQTALDRVNVRMLLIFLKVNLTQTLRSFVFEQNDAATRARIRDTIEPFLADVGARRGLTAFKVVVDETNNTPERIDRNELHVSVFIKPTRAAEFIVLNLVTLRTGASFASQEVLAAGGVVTA